MSTRKSLLPVVLIATLAVSMLPWQLAGAATVPFKDSLEAVPLTGWTSNGIPATSGTRLEGTKSLSLTQASVTLSVGGGEANVWCAMYVQPTVFEAEPDLAALSSETAAFCVVNVGGTPRLHVMDGSSWVNTGLAVTPASWVGFSVHLDYDRSMWDLYVDSTGTLNTEMTRVAGAPFDMRANLGGSLSQVTISNTKDSAALVDLFSLNSAFNSEILPIPNNDETFVVEREVNGGSAYYTNTVFDFVAGENTLDINDAAGRSLAAGLEDGDAIAVFTKDGWQNYQFTGGAFAPLGGATAPGSLALIMAMPVRVTRVLGGTDNRAVVSYDPDALAAVGSPVAYNKNEGCNGWMLYKRTSATANLNSSTYSGNLFSIFKTSVGGVGGAYELRLPGAPTTRVLWINNGLGKYWSQPGGGGLTLPQVQSIQRNGLYWILNTTTTDSDPITDN